MDGSSSTEGGADEAGPQADRASTPPARGPGSGRVPGQARSAKDNRAAARSGSRPAGAATATLAVPQAQGRHASAPAAPGGPRESARARPPAPGGDLFARYTRDYVADKVGRQVLILHAGCATAEHDLGAGQLRESGADLAEALIDDDAPAVRTAVAASPALAGATLGDLRSVPLPPRSADIAHCSLLLERISHAELVLDRVVAAVKPGGLLLLRVRDRDSAAGMFDRFAPQSLRRRVWRAQHPGRPGPYPAVYEKLASARGVQSYVLLRGLVVAERRALGGTGGGLARGPGGHLLAQRLIARLSRGRLTAAHEELLYVLRKPEDRFARLV